MGLFKKNIHPLMARRKLKDSDPNFSVIDAIDSVLQEAEQETINSKIHLYLHSAKGAYLDEHGTWYGVYRLDGENDNAYRNRIIKYIQMPRGTNQALILATRRFLNDPTIGVRVYEPWENIFKLNRSKLNGPDKLMGRYYRFAVVEVSIGVPFDTDLIDYLKRFLTAGVELHVNYDPSLPRTTDTGAYIASPVLNIYGYSPITTGITQSGLDVTIGGRIRLSDTKELFDPFKTNESKVNSTDVLTGSFNQYRENLHVFGLGRDYRPNMNTMLGESLTYLTELEEDRSLLDNIDNQKLSVAMNPSQELYMGLNLDAFVQAKYYGSGYKIPQTKERYVELFKRSAFTWVANMDTQGHTLEVQVYNFHAGTWHTLNRQVTSTGNQKHNEFMDAIIQGSINTNRLMFFRFKASKAYQLNLDYIGYDFQQKLN